MRSKLNVLVAAAAVWLVAPQLAAADNVEEQLQLMNERMSQLEDQLQATQDQLGNSEEQVARQQDVIEKAGLDREAQSGLSGFLQQVEVGGWVTASYFYNMASPRDSVMGSQSDVGGTYGESGGMNNGFNGGVAPFHPDHNSFSVDQLWFEIEKPATEESRGGFRADILFGRTASILDTGQNRDCGTSAPRTGGNDNFYFLECQGDSASDVSVYQAYVQYLTPWGPTVKAGKMSTWVGAETVGAVYNFNITRGLVWSLLQPITHYGLTVDGDSNGFIYGLGVVNSIFSVDPDFNNAKTLMAKLGYGGETWSVVSSLLYGTEEIGSTGSDQVGIANLVAKWDPTENFSGWIDFTYDWQNSCNGVFPFGTDNLRTCPELVGSENTSGSPNAWGIAAAGRYGITERLGFAMRGEFVQDNRNFLRWESSTNGRPVDVDIWGFTGTVDYTLTDNMVVKAEVRYDNADFVPEGSGGDNNFLNGKDCGGVDDSDCYTNDDQWLMGLEVTYRF